MSVRELQWEGGWSDLSIFPCPHSAAAPPHCHCAASPTTHTHNFASITPLSVLGWGGTWNREKETLKRNASLPDASFSCHSSLCGTCPEGHMCGLSGETHSGLHNAVCCHERCSPAWPFPVLSPHLSPFGSLPQQAAFLHQVLTR